MAVCEVPNCSNVAVSHGICAMHRLRFNRHGSVDVGRPAGWGSGRSHPLYERWRSMRRTSKQTGGNVSDWDKFWPFVRDVGEPLTASHRLYRIDNQKPFGPGNFRWREPLGLTQENRESKNAYMREWTRARPHLRKALYLKKHYGVTLEWYDEKFTQQDGKCEICHKPERRLDHRTKEPFLLAVDHDHKTGIPRDLLCSFCNHGLGNFDDNPDRLRAAISYLERHAVDTPPKPA
jgi:hypothetical protein